MYIKFLKIGTALIITFLVIYLGSLVDWIFVPLQVLVSTLFVPIVITGVLFYISRPIVDFFSRKLPRVVSILLLYLGFGALIVGLVSLIVPELRLQLEGLVEAMPTITMDIQLMLVQLQQHEWVQRLDLTELFDWEEQLNQLGTVANNIVRDIAVNTTGFLGAVVNMLVLLFVVPFVLFYLLKEGEKLPRFVLRFISDEKRDEVRGIMEEMDMKLSQYIKGLLIVCSFIGVLCYIAFSLLGLDYALMLALFALVTNVIPYVGPWIGAVPAAVVGFLHSPLIGILVIVSIFVIQQIESYFVQPQVLGRKMEMHPVTVLFLVLVAGRFAGIAGMLLAVPSYAIGKVIVTHSYRLWKIRLAKEKREAL